MFWRNAFHILNLCLDVIEGVAGFNIKNYGLANLDSWPSPELDENIETSCASGSLVAVTFGGLLTGATGHLSDEALVIMLDCWTAGLVAAA